ncbi:MAG: hypothetical protein HRT35_10650 [Algicola sp.]|nr:hypothetical protein [Algicola sp.]
MKFFKRWFNKPPKPVLSYEDLQLGMMRFDDEDESWVGRYNGYEFRIGYQHQKLPQSELLRYCFDTLSNRSGLEGILQQQKDQQKQPANSALHGEIDGLRYYNLMFYRNDQQMCILAQLTDDDSERLWRVEFCDDQCGGIGFDI